MKYNTVIFDLDGTLLNTLDDLADSVNFALEKNKYPNHPTDRIRTFIGNGIKLLIERAVPKGISEEEFKKVFNDFVKHYEINSRNKTAPYKGIPELLTILKEKGYKLAIVSNKIDFAVKDLRDEFFAGLIEIAIGDSEDTENKPAPDMVFKALNELSSTAEKSVYVGDTDVDLKTAENSGMDCISVSWGFRSRNELEDYKAEMIADTAEDVLKFIEG